VTGRERFIAAVEGRPVDRPPVWLMRQAGRYLPEYRELRKRHTFTQMYKSPDVATEVTLQPIRRFGFDAAILFSDILVIPEAMGLPLDFPEGGPVFGKTARTEADIAALRPVSAEKDLGYVQEALTRLRQELGEQTALIGFAGAPYTLASYSVEGGSSKSFEHIKRLEYRSPELFQQLLDKMTDAIIDYLVMQVRAGADAVQLFDSWGGNLTPAAFERYALPCARRIFEAVRKAGGRSIYFVLGSAGMLDLVSQAGADVVGVDWHTSFPRAIEQLGPRAVVQGNFDPLALHAPPAEVYARAQALVAEGRKAKGHIVNVGHGLIPSTPIEGVEAFVRGIQESARK
jgi:uroporphyrinogen decarboxylase